MIRIRGLIDFNNSYFLKLFVKWIFYKTIQGYITRTIDLIDS